MSPSSPDASPAVTHYFTPRREPLNEATLRRHVRTVQACGVALEMATGAGVFAKSGLDAGSRLLLEIALRDAATWPDGARICDLGCGWGALGCFAARRAPQARVFMCDINAHAVALARWNARQNALANAFTWCGDGLDAAREAQFDVVLCNPPVRAGNATIARLFAGAERCLRRDGVLWMVLRTAQGAKSWQKRLQQQFGHCESVALGGGYRVFKSVTGASIKD